MASETCLDGGLQPIILCSGMGPNPTQAEHTRLGSSGGNKPNEARGTTNGP